MQCTLYNLGFIFSVLYKCLYTDRLLLQWIYYNLLKICIRVNWSWEKLYFFFLLEKFFFIMTSRVLNEKKTDNLWKALQRLLNVIKLKKSSSNINSHQTLYNKIKYFCSGLLITGKCIYFRFCIGYYDLYALYITQYTMENICNALYLYYINIYVCVAERDFSELRITILKRKRP